MQQIKTTYQICFGIDISKNSEPNKKEINLDDIEIKEKFDFFDYNLETAIDSIKEFFLNSFSNKYPLCKCEISLFCKDNNVLIELTGTDKTKLSYKNLNNLYLIKTKKSCNCEYKKYKIYMNMPKFEIIKHLKDKIEYLEKVEADLEDAIKKKY